MIPKIIHYCWLSNEPIPMDLQRYMDSWKQYLSDYEFIKWDFSRFPKDKSVWVSEAYDNKKYAFAADYIRLYALYNFGGIYLDMDVEVLKSFDNFLTLDTMICFEKFEKKGHPAGLEVAAFGAKQGASWIKSCLDYYNDRHFVLQNGDFDTTILPLIVKRSILQDGYKIKKVFHVKDAELVQKSEIPVFPCEYFSPKDAFSGKIQVTNKSYSIHHFSGSWEPAYYRKEKLFWHSLGLRDWRILLRIHNLFKYGTIRSNPKRK